MDLFVIPIHTIDVYGGLDEKQRQELSDYGQEVWDRLVAGEVGKLLNRVIATEPFLVPAFTNLAFTHVRDCYERGLSRDEAVNEISAQVKEADQQARDEALLNSLPDDGLKH